MKKMTKAGLTIAAVGATAGGAWWAYKKHCPQKARQMEHALSNMASIAKKDIENMM